MDDRTFGVLVNNNGDFERVLRMIWTAIALDPRAAHFGQNTSEKSRAKRPYEVPKVPYVSLRGNRHDGNGVLC